MALKVRSVLAISVGVVLGLGISLASGWLAGRQADRASVAESRIAGLDVLVEVMDRVRREYVEPVDEQALIDAAVRGVVAELDDHSRYLDPRQYEEIRISTSGNYSGVGLDVSLEDGRLRVVTPLDGTPAQAAGILPGDVLLSVDNVPIDEQSLEEAVTRMRGVPGTRVTLDVQRQGADEPVRFALTRADIRVKTVTSEYLGGGFGYLKVSGFADGTAAHLAAAVQELKEAASPTKLRGVAFDLRGNPGGVLEAAVDVADAFLEGGLIVRGSGRASEARFEKHARPGDLLAGVPLVVLVDGSSASASEIVAGALQDHGRARIVGERTFGKGSVQTVVPLAGGGALKLTTSRYLTPSGRTINGHGIEPDLTVQSDAAARYRGPRGAVSPADDRQLQAALRLIGDHPIALSAVP